MSETTQYEVLADRELDSQVFDGIGLQPYNLVGAQWTRVSAQGGHFRVAMTSGAFRSVNFTKAKFDKCRLKDAHFLDCMFIRARLVVNADGAVFDRCDFSSAVFSGGRPGNEYGGRRMRFSNCDFENATFRGVEIRASIFNQCSFAGAIFKDCDIRGAKFENAKALSNEVFQNCLGSPEI